MSQNTEKIKKYLIENLAKLESEGGSGTYPTLPSFDLCALDYISYAEDELKQHLSNNSNRNLINCVLHLKRAIECQLDTFLHAYALYDLFKKRNLGLDKKLDFLKEIGVLSSRTLNRFNTLRNKLEHQYEVPKIADIELYFDLASSAVSIIESAILYAIDYERIFVTEEYGHPNREVFCIEYDFKVPEIKIMWERSNGREELIASTADIEEYAYFFKVFVLLRQRDAIVSDRYVLAKL
ncbi:MAG: hypothetical protein ILNGONEN_01827 [Syntrophorhabdaceae bacterium]|nr:hypothetical protein [Syntrophorhabdaceae bacterium]